MQNIKENFACRAGERSLNNEFSVMSLDIENFFDFSLKILFSCVQQNFLKKVETLILGNYNLLLATTY